MNQFDIEPTKRLSLIYEQAREVAKSCVNSAIPINRFLRSSQEMARMIGIYEAEKSFLEAYFLSLKTVFIFQIEIKTHNQYKTLHPTQLQQLKTKVVNALDTAERTKPKVNLILEKQFIEYKQQEAERIKLKQEQEKFNQPQNNTSSAQTSQTSVTNYQLPNRPTSFKSPPKLIYPANLISTFKTAAAQNSSLNRETCGFLFGTVTKNTYTLTHLFIPKQSGTPDTCQPTDDGEMEMFEFGTSNNLVGLGWIHTHPSQTAFLSSVDMHTQFSQQTLLPVAIAIVCSIKYNETRFLHLTDLGMEKVRQKLTNNVSSGEFCNYEQDRSSLQKECDFVELRNDFKIITVDKR